MSLPGYTAALRRLSRFARVVTFDKRGQGLSDRISGAPSLEQRMDDVRAVMDSIGSARAILIGFSEGCRHERLVRGDLSRARAPPRACRRVGTARPCRTTCGANAWSAR